jgi:hypothetical protein
MLLDPDQHSQWIRIRIPNGSGSRRAKIHADPDPHTGVYDLEVCFLLTYQSFVSLMPRDLDY